MTNEELEAILQRHLVPIQHELKEIRVEQKELRIHTEGLPLLGRVIEALRADTRHIRAAVDKLENAAESQR